MGTVAAVAIGLWLTALPGQAPGRGPGAARAQDDPLMAAARRAARAWQRHDFSALVAGSPGVLVRLGGAEHSTPMPPAQAVLTLRAFAGGAQELQTVVTAVREVDAGRGYAEVQRTFRAKGTDSRRVQTLYLEWRRTGRVQRLVEIRVVP